MDRVVGITVFSEAQSELDRWRFLARHRLCRTILLDHLSVRLGELLASCLDRGLIDSGGVGQIAQRLRAIAFQVHVGLMALVDDRRVPRRLVHHGDGRLGGRSLGGYQVRAHARRWQDRCRSRRFDVRFLIKRMTFGKVGEQSAGFLDHRQSELLAQRDQRLVGVDLLAGAFGEHDRVLRLGNRGGELFDVLRRGQHARRRRNLARIGRRVSLSISGSLC